MAGARGMLKAYSSMVAKMAEIKATKSLKKALASFTDQELFLLQGRVSKELKDRKVCESCGQKYSGSYCHCKNDE